jgi:hypothetical protein
MKSDSSTLSKPVSVV